MLDRGGRWGPRHAAVIGGFNHQSLKDQRLGIRVARMILTQFNTEVTPPTPAVPIAEVLPLTPATYTPGGNTALFDAIAQTVGRADAEKRPCERVFCLIVTDGEENSSRETTLEQVRTIIREREGRGDWTFAYLGAAPDRWAAETGMSAGSSAAFCAAEPRASFQVASEATRRLRASSRASTRTFFDRDKRS